MLYYLVLPRSPHTTMFFIKELTHTILLHPSYFGPRMLNFLESKLYADVEGTCSGSFGYIIAVVSILDIGKGMVLSGSGQAEFITRYRAIVFKPFKGEVVDGVVSNVNKVRLFILLPRSTSLHLSLSRWVSSQKSGP
jgi:DNA-directed RNA polymerase II subunit RPB7